ncbi:dUTP diphosphatase [Breznakiella homolactica]|uniref:Deoxyuridine 5'-triphosphate nucleotidohydrolase n=1 Tax=Breznakiella homolactica TaxID=2798577 RepID=A0A7T7XKQ6_9SPIR|nr:dUTP diphosphatase [Breznakiella homolactica]QQO08184.1 dUTP diphosphatase [Breznakiella homolactica]
MKNTENPAVRILKLNPRASLPSYETAGAAGADIRALLDEPRIIPPQGRDRIPTGLIMEIPEGYEVQVRPRSGLAAKHGVTVLNTPGTIDSDYRGEVQVILVNLGTEAFTVHDGDRIAQCVVAPVCTAAFRESAEISESRRGSGGFGSTGL